MDYLNSRAAAASLLDKVPSSTAQPPGPLAATTAASSSSSSYEYHESPLTHANSNFMYSNWIGLHTKSPLQANYLIGLQGTFAWDDVCFWSKLLFTCNGHILYTYMLICRSLCTYIFLKNILGIAMFVHKSKYLPMLNTRNFDKSAYKKKRISQCNFFMVRACSVLSLCARMRLYNLEINKFLCICMHIMSMMRMLFGI